MSNAEMREPRWSESGEPFDDAPKRLRQLSDLAKAATLAGGISRAVGQAFAAEIEGVRYGALDRLREFQRPAEVRVSVSSMDAKGCERLHAVPEADLETAIAASLGKAAAEDYRVRIVDKQYGRPLAAPGAMRLTVQVGRA